MASLCLTSRAREVTGLSWDGRASESQVRAMTSERRSLMGAGAALGAVAVLAACMAPLRSHLSIATAALVLVVPVVVGVVIGGFVSGAVAAVAGFFVYDLVFIPPYGTLNVGEASNWVALAVYVVVVLLVAQVVARLEVARAQAHRRETEIRRLFELTELLISEKPIPELLALIVSTVHDAFALDSVALLLPTGRRLDVAAAAGRPLSDEELARITPAPGRPTSLGSSSSGPDEVQSVALSATGRPIGLLGLRGRSLSRQDRELLLTFANHIALTVERAQLRDQALRTELLDEIDRLQKTLMGAVSHDLRTPLATIKISATTLRNPDAELGADERQELLTLIDDQVDRLNRLVTNLLDMSRVQAGALELRRQPVAVVDLVREAMSGLGLTDGSGHVVLDLAPDLPAVDVDHLLIGQVLTNLLDNASRYAPPDTAITVSGRRRPDGYVEVAVTDSGPGVRPDDRTAVFQMFTGRGSAGGSGVGLWIAKAFVEAHGQQIWVQDAEGHGARFAFTLPVALEPAPVA
jgi:two-component system sensor histidine kinase KdpD